MSDSRRFKAKDPFLLQYQPSELKIASEFLTSWLPFLSRDLCHRCTRNLANRIRSIVPDENVSSSSSPNNMENPEVNETCDDNCDTDSLGSWKDGANGLAEPSTSGCAYDIITPHVESQSPRLSWADMAQEDELGDEEEHRESNTNTGAGDVRASAGEVRISKTVEKPVLSREQREQIRFANVKRKKDFMCFERVKGKLVNILQGLELHTGVFSAVEQKRIVDYIYELQEKARKGEFKERTYTAPTKWMRGKGRVTIQFGCCYNYATDKNGNPPGILQHELVDPIPHLLKVIIRRMVKWHVLPPTCVPDSCIVNIYEEGDCIPPHIDSHDFVRPFCTVSFLSECDIVFGSNLKIVGPGEFAGSIAIPLPVGSVLVLNGNGADVAKHCVPAVPTKRISITFRKMDEAKQPSGFTPEPDLQGIQPLQYKVDKTKSSNSSTNSEHHARRGFAERSNPRSGYHGTGRSSRSYAYNQRGSR